MSSAVDAYLAPLPTDQREALEGLRRTIHAVVPDVEEVIRMGVPAFRYNRRPLVSIGAAKRHVAMYIMYGSALEMHRHELQAFDTSRTVIRFTPDKPLPAHLVSKLVMTRKAEIENLTD